MNKNIVLIILLSFFSATKSFAAFACFTQTNAMPVQTWGASPLAMQCSTKANIALGLKGVGVTFQAASLYAACTGAGIPVALYLQGGSLATSVVEMVVGELPCEANDTEEKIKKMTRDIICESLEQNGIECLIKL